MKRLFALCLAIALLATLAAPITAFAATESSGTLDNNVTWELAEDGTLTIAGTGAMPEPYYSYPWSEYDVTAVVIEEGITSIPGSAFSGYDYLKTLTLPSSLESIGGSAFDGCYDLADVYVTNIDAWVKVDFGGSALGYEDYELHIQDSAGKEITSATVTGIEVLNQYVFMGCTHITEINLPEGLTEIGYSAFSGCEKLAKVNIIHKNKAANIKSKLAHYIAKLA